VISSVNLPASALISIAPPAGRWDFDGIAPPARWLVIQGEQDEIVDFGALFDSDKRNLMALEVQGDSMIEDQIADGDFVVVRHQPDASAGDIVVALIDGEATVKTFLRDGDDIVLRPENPSMNPIRVTGSEDFAIAGKVISVIRRIEK